jgi:hypothetical protein
MSGLMGVIRRYCVETAGYGFASNPPHGTSVIARSDSDEAIHAPASGAMDCFAEPVIGRAFRRPATTKTQFHLRPIDPTGKSPKVCPSPRAKIFRFAVRQKQLYRFQPSRLVRGAYRDRHERGADAVDAGGARDERAHFADGEVVWFL